jgi:hypothetical protein
MNALYSLIIVLALVVIPLLGAGPAGWHSLFGVTIPYLAFGIFVIGFIYRVVDWGRSAEPFCELFWRFFFSGRSFAIPGCSSRTGPS